MSRIFGAIPVLCRAVAIALSPQAAAQDAYPAKPVRFIAPFPRWLDRCLVPIIAQKLDVFRPPGYRRQSTRCGRKHRATTLPPNRRQTATRCCSRPRAAWSSIRSLQAAPVRSTERLRLHLVGHLGSAGPGGAPEYRCVTSQLIALAKARPGQLNYGSGGVGTTAHVVGEFLKVIAGIEMVHVPYKGGAVALIDLIAGQTDLQFGDMVPSVPLVRAGKLRALAVTTGQRSAALPGIPTMAEAGINEQFPTQWWGVSAPKGTPRPIIDRVNAELGKLVKSPDVLELFDNLGVFPEHTTPERMLEIVKAEGPPTGKLLKAAGIEPQ